MPTAADEVSEKVTPATSQRRNVVVAAGTLTGLLMCATSLNHNDPFKLKEWPARFVGRLRTEAAPVKLAETAEKLEAVAERVGFGGGETLRRHLRAEPEESTPAHRFPRECRELVRMDLPMAADEIVGEVTPANTRRHKVVIGAGVLLCLLIAAFVLARVRAGETSVRGSADADSRAVYAAVAPVQRETVANSLSIAGQFIPYQNVELHAKVAGYIKHIYVDIGDRVHTGEVLAVLEIPELVAQVDAAKAAVHHAQEEIQRAQSEVSRAEADNVALHANAVRLVDTDKARPGLIAQQELDDATAKDRASRAQVDAAKSALAAAKQQLEVAKADEQHYAALSDYATITAPYQGVVTWRYADTGALVQAGTSNTSGLPVVTVAEVDVLRLRIPVPESLAAKVRIGDSADVQVQATGEHFTGQVTRFTDALDPATRTMQVEIDVPNPNYHLQPGMYANVNLQANSRPDALTIPVTAILRTENKASVLVLDSQNRVQVRQVRLGVESSTRVEVLSGLSEGERVIAGNLGSYQAGEVVRPRQAILPGAQNDAE